MMSIAVCGPLGAIALVMGIGIIILSAVAPNFVQLPWPKLALIAGSVITFLVGAMILGIGVIFLRLAGSGVWSLVRGKPVYGVDMTRELRAESGK